VSANGYLPRLSYGAAGLFMLSADGTSASADPGTLAVRKYDPATHAFGGPVHLATLAPTQTGFADGGGLDENSSTGELAAVWPVFGGTSTVMRLYVSTDGGVNFSGGQEIATVGGGYGVMDNARVALANDGSGFLTFRDGSGIEVADLFPLAAAFRVLSARGGGVGVPFTCTAPHRTCHVVASITAGALKASAARARTSAAVLARGVFTIPAGGSRTLKVRLTAAGRHALRSRRNRLNATLKLTITGEGSTHTTTSAVRIS
jgi:hypothetical protein